MKPRIVKWCGVWIAQTLKPYTHAGAGSSPKEAFDAWVLINKNIAEVREAGLIRYTLSS